jgi:DNA-binding transcriptional regulator YiaG
MPNIGSVLKEEITRLSRKEVRKQIEPVRKSSNQQRTEIARLKRDVSALRNQIRTLSKSSSVPAIQQDRPAEMIRFVAKGLKAQRTRLGLSAADYAKLVGVSGQTVYNWEQGAATPRTEQRATLASLRGIGKREAQARLQKLNGKASGNGAGHTRG